ncbi:G-type lectin S-receptor-like serine/threonine-protein kinase At4g27290 [Ipomoea triloba]|uniref:G-type lectin S-receptor-like serine/threonine-protein kinase At4g27290 n=1 Tax=Ipomoea triloba TaxID=35885 RepID=UPI00125CED66|nr:G-type lectin S-receptor-like serine/threonine-protein kinase At4g27290 [Ipomoea triloba]
MVFIIIFFFFISINSISNFSTAVDTLPTNQKLSDDGATATLVSATQTFVLGFFSPGTSRNRYLGIWFGNVPEQTVVWVANNNNPIPDSSGALILTPTGDITITHTHTHTNQANIVWSSNSSSPRINNPSLHLLDNGNLVVKNGHSFVWQSFDYPGNTLLPGMKLGWNLKTKTEWYMTSWRNENDPSTGDFSFTYRLDILGLPTVILRKGETVQFRTGTWDGTRLGQYSLSDLYYMGVFKISLVYNDEDAYFWYQCLEASTISRLVVTHTGVMTVYIWSKNKNGWLDTNPIQGDHCDTYGTCGNNNLCNAINLPPCECLDGFQPTSPLEWESLQWSSGCVRRKLLNCSEPQGFKKFSDIKLPDNSRILGNRTAMSLADCEEACLGNCSCSAYAWAEVVGCAVWYGDLHDMRLYYSEAQDLYVRMPKSELNGPSKTGRQRLALIASSVSIIIGLVFLAITTWYGFHAMVARRKTRVIGNEESLELLGDSLELPIIGFDELVAATNNFSDDNKLGAGGFGPVYKGILTDGQEIAVKRLYSFSGQGIEEFKNEILLISKLQHRNLVRLLGCSIHGEEKLLVYEHMKNKSLDIILFDPTRKVQLDWGKRVNIIQGIARGLVYLHRDSCLRIIHRDLKASNILLDEDMNPKISDFGLARAFRATEELANTHRVVGTFGYMSPEYVMRGLFSEKSDVYSFGVLLLEVVSGRKICGFHSNEEHSSLLNYVWQLWIERREVDLIDESITNSCCFTEALRCIRIGLLCVQDRVSDRPTMSNVVLMLCSEVDIPQPKRPTFTFHSLLDSDSKSRSSRNEITVSITKGR